LKGGEKLNITGMLFALPSVPVTGKKAILTSGEKERNPFSFQMLLEAETGQNLESDSFEMEHKDPFMTKIVDVANELLNKLEEKQEKAEVLVTENESQQRIIDQYDRLETIHLEAEKLLLKLKTNPADQELLSQAHELFNAKQDAETGIAKGAVEMLVLRNPKLKETQLDNAMASVLQEVLVETDSHYLQRELNVTSEMSAWDQIRAIVSANGEMTQNDKVQIFNRNFPVVNHVDVSQPELGQRESQLLVQTGMQQMQDLFQRAEQVISNISSSKKIPEVSPEVFQLLKQWTATEKQLQNLAPIAQANHKESPIDVIWKELVSSFKKQEQYVLRNPYQVENEVTAKDVSRWLESIWNTSVEKPIPQSSIMSAMPMSKLEQYVVHLQHNQSPQLAQQSFNQQFENIIQSSRLLTQPAGQSVLSITLNPSNLGEMLVRMTEVDGEMMVKIVVTTSRAKEMLESNMHQLRHMFSPHQVQIERQEAQLNITQTAGDKEGLDEEKEREGQQEQQEQNQNGEQPERDFSDYFRKSLLNEEV
jgi:flagellar hook-length control protein FliK